MSSESQLGKLPRLLSVSEVAEWLGMSSAWVRAHASGRRRPRIPAVRFGSEDSRSVWKFQPADVENFIKEQRVE